MADNTIPIPNAPHWLNHSMVVLKGPVLASDGAWVTNQIIAAERASADGENVESHAGDQLLFKVKRMVKEGTVAVMLKGGAKYEVSLPKDVNKLLLVDLAYISQQIDATSEPMNAQEQADFLASVNGRSEASLKVVK